jgi:hypothetical protein
MIDLQADVEDELSFSFDHVETKRDGGTDRNENLRPAHRCCNEARGYATLPIEPPDGWPAPRIIVARGLAQTLPRKPCVHPSGGDTIRP